MFGSNMITTRKQYINNVIGYAALSVIYSILVWLFTFNAITNEWSENFASLYVGIFCLLGCPVQFAISVFCLVFIHHKRIRIFEKHAIVFDIMLINAGWVSTILATICTLILSN